MVETDEEGAKKDVCWKLKFFNVVGMENPPTNSDGVQAARGNV